MDTKNFNIVDRLIAKMRLSKVLPHIREGDVVLDFGCGSQGYFLNYISPIISKGVGIDYDVENMTKENLQFKKFVFNNRLPFQNDSFDKIVLLAVLEHIEWDKINLLFKEFERILKSDGQIILTTPTPKSKQVLEFLAYNLHIISEEEIIDHKRYYDKTNIDELIRICNLNIDSYNLFQIGFNSCAVLEKNN